MRRLILAIIVLLPFVLFAIGDKTFTFEKSDSELYYTHKKIDWNVFTIAADFGYEIWSLDTTWDGTTNDTIVSQLLGLDRAENVILNLNYDIDSITPLYKVYALKEDTILDTLNFGGWNSLSVTTTEDVYWESFLFDFAPYIKFMFIDNSTNGINRSNFRPRIIFAR